MITRFVDLKIDWGGPWTRPHVFNASSRGRRHRCLRRLYVRW